MVFGINICNNSDFFKRCVLELLEEMSYYTNMDISVNKRDINIVDGYVGLGYAQSQKEEIGFISSFAQMEGIILDSVYTGKAMYGLGQEIKKGNFHKYNNILFIHTGGLFGWSSGQIDLLGNS